ncbi:hypothetical protein ACXR2T_09750 [Leucobacter sp. HY1910]
MNISEFAQREGISVQRAAKLAREDRIPAHKERGRWIVDCDASPEKRSRRPLSRQSQDDFLYFMDRRTFDGITGSRKARAAERVRTFAASKDPVQLLRDWWADSPDPEGRGFAVLVRLAKRGTGDMSLIRDRQRGLGVWMLDNPIDIAGRISDWRAIRGVSIHELSEATGVPETIIRTIERRGVSPRGNRDVAMIVKKLKVPATRIQSERSTHA